MSRRNMSADVWGIGMLQAGASGGRVPMRVWVLPEAMASVSLFCADQNTLKG